MAVSYNEMMTGGSQKKKKKQPTMAQAQGAGVQQPQTYGQPSMAQAQGQQDPLVSAIAAGSQAQNQQPTMAQAQGGMQPQQQQPTMQQAQGGATLPPPPPPPPPAPSMAQAQAPSAPQPTMAQAQQQQPVAQPATGDLGNIRAKAVANGETTEPVTFGNLQLTPEKIAELSAIGQNAPAVEDATVTLPDGNTVDLGFNYTDISPDFVDNLPKINQEPTQPISETDFLINAVGNDPTGINKVSEMPIVDPIRPTGIDAISEMPITNPFRGTGIDEISEMPIPNPSRGTGIDEISEMPIERPFRPSGIDEISEMPIDPIAKAITQGPSMAEAQAPTTPTDALGAGADMAAAQNVVEPEAAPMADTLEGALRQQYMDRIGGTDDPILASQLADQQFRQNEARKALVEQLGRYGVLRGGGDTAAALARMGEGDERNRLALEAQAAQRRQQDLRDAQGFDLGQRGMGLQETRSQQDTLTQALNRDIARAGQTGIFERDETMAAKRQRAELDALSRGQERADAELTGEFGDDGQKTLAGQQLESQLFGEIDGRQTLTGETTQSGLQTEDMQRRIAEAGQTGLFDQEIEGVDPVETQQARALGSELETAALGRDATRAGLTGTFDDDPTLEARLREAAMTGRLGEGEDERLTLAGRGAEMDTIGAILAGRDLNDRKLDSLLQGLTENIDSRVLGDQATQRFTDASGFTSMPEPNEFMSPDNKRRYEELRAMLDERGAGINPNERALIYEEMRRLNQETAESGLFDPVRRAMEEYRRRQGE